MDKLARDRAKTEKNKITRLLKAAGTDEKTLKLLASTISNTAMLKAKLDDAMETIEEEDIVSEYDNGGGQSGTRINPAFTAYTSLYKSYCAGMKIILDAMPKQAASQKKELEAPTNMLAVIQARKKA